MGILSHNIIMYVQHHTYICIFIDKSKVYINNIHTYLMYPLFHCLRLNSYVIYGYRKTFLWKRYNKKFIMTANVLKMHN